MTGTTVGIQLGTRYAFKPANVPAIRPLEIMRMVREAFSTSSEFALIRDRVDHDFGRPRQLSVDVLIGACIAAAATNKSDMHVRGVAALLRALPVPDQRVLNVRWVDPNGGGEQLVTERQVAYLFMRVAAAFHLADARHNHLFALDDEIWTPEGNYAGDLDQLPEDLLGSLECDESCPLGISMQALGNRLLHILWKYTGMPESECYAIDSTVVETHFAPRSYGSLADISKDFVTDTDKDIVAPFTDQPTVKIQGKGPTTKETRLTAGKLYEEWAEQKQPERNPRSRRPPPVGPVVHGEFRRSSNNFPQLGPDRRLIHTKDAGARSAYRGSGSSRGSQITNGRDQHALVASGRLPDGSPFPPFQRSYNAVAGRYDKTDSVLRLFDTAVSLGVQPCPVTMDRIYTVQPAEKFEHLAVAEGWTIIRDLKQNQRRPRQWAGGIDFLDGWWFTSGLPNGLIDLPRPHMNATTAERHTSQQRFDARQPYTMRISARLANGGFRLRGPAIPDQVTKDPVTGIPTAARGVRVRCINSPYHHLLPRTLPQTTCIQGQSCGCSATITVRANEIPNSCEPLLWGTTAWAKEYARRNLSETLFSVEQHHYGLSRHSIRVRAHKWDFAFAMVTIAHYIRLFHSFVMRLGAWKLDPGYHSALDPECFNAAMQRVLTPLSIPTKARTTAPPGS